MKIRRIYTGRDGRRRVQQNAGTHLLAKAALVGALTVAASACMYQAYTSLTKFDYSNFWVNSESQSSSKSSSETSLQDSYLNENTSVQAVPGLPDQTHGFEELQGLEALVETADSGEASVGKVTGTPLPTPDTARPNGSNGKKELAEKNVEILKKKNPSDYVSEAMVDGKKQGPTLTALVKESGSEQKLGLVSDSQDFPELDYDSLHRMEKIIYDKLQAYNTSNPVNPIDFDLARAIAYCESHYRADAVAKKVQFVKHGKKTKRREIRLGRGLFQIMPDTARRLIGKRFSDKELLDEEISAELGLAYIGYLQDSPYVKRAQTEEGRIKRLLAAYNGGEPAIMPSEQNPRLLRYENPVNKGYRETRNYVRKVTSVYNAFKKESNS